MTSCPAPEGIARTPFIVDHRQIGMADPVVDPYLDIFRLEFSRVIFIEFDCRPPLWRRSFLLSSLCFPLRGAELKSVYGGKGRARR